MESMTDQEITKVIAEFMGWTKVRLHHGSMVGGKPSGNGDGVVPDYLLDDNACMMAWDKFSEKYRTNLVKQDSGVWIAFFYQDVDCLFDVSNTDRRRAMCECMAKAV